MSAQRMPVVFFFVISLCPLWFHISKALLNHHKAHIIHKMGYLPCVFCALCGHNKAILYLVL
jgi:hypothetical protein